MTVVTLTTDFAGSGYYLAALKGVVLSVFPDVQLVEISQNIKAREFREAAFTVQKAFKYFPEKTIHIIHVHAADSCGRLLIAEFQNHFFVVFDNGTAPLIFEYEAVQYFDVQSVPENGSLFLKTISSALKSIQENTYQKPLASPPKILRRLSASGSRGNIKGNIIYLDKFGNAITNISFDFWNTMIKTKFEININGDRIDKISRFYADILSGELGAFFNAENLLEITIGNGSAAQLLGLRVDGTVMATEIRG